MSGNDETDKQKKQEASETVELQQQEEKESAERTLRERIAFPVLSEEQIAQFERFAACRTFDDGETLFEAGEADFGFFVVTRGEIEIIERSSGEPRRVALHGPGEFTGDVDMLSGKPALVSAVARGATSVLEVACDDIQSLITELPDLGERIMRAFIARRELLIASDFEGVKVIGDSFSPDAHQIREFLAKNQIPSTWIDVETDKDVGAMLRRFGVTEKDLPVVVADDERLFRNPSIRALADALGVRRPPDDCVYDLVVVGAGPAGLAAAVYGASEGLNTLVLEGIGPGGQAGSSSKIENYLGFPTGLSGDELAKRATLQAEKFGARFSSPSQVKGMEFAGDRTIVLLEEDERVEATCVLIATGAHYRTIEAEGRKKFEGAGIYYSATPTEAQICSDSSIAIVGGGNSAGQAAMYMSEHVQKVYILLKEGDLHTFMSSYLAQRIEGCPTIEVLLGAEITAFEGTDHLEAIVVKQEEKKEDVRLDVAAAFIFIGADPCTAWLPEEIATDERGYILTGRAAARSPHWTEDRAPFYLETSRPGVFAAGDVRADSVKRVASAVGEGAMAVQFVHEYRKVREEEG